MEKYIVFWVIMIITNVSEKSDLNTMRDCKYNNGCYSNDTVYITKYEEFDSLDNAIYFYDKMRFLKGRSEIINTYLLDSIQNCPKALIINVDHNDFGFIYEITGK